ncbi:metallopeptidase family protein [Peptoniphilus timonensis]|uniref:metallopeptidase family protein n=1 Tax=Peptoniphilus timonensis TaxID=1268254 RepID=UPI0002FDCC01|nr:metallopeptidase family protein [Peptoniphilus timonensis]
MIDENGKKIFYSDGENNFDIPLELIQEIYDKREDEIFLNSDKNIELPKTKEDDSFISEKDHEDKEEDREIISNNYPSYEEESEDDYYLNRIDEVEEILDEICESIPAYAFDHLNGGIILVEDKKYHEEARNDDLLVMGEYQRSVLGNMIKIYYGSFMEMYRFSSSDRLREKLEEVLLHEFTHHLEFLANEWGLVIEDKKFLEEYRKGIKNE